MSELVVSLDQPAARLPAVAGGKGSALAKMRSAGFPVPRGFVVTTEAFRLASFNLPRDLERQLAEANPSDLGTLESLCQPVQASITGTGIPSEVASAVISAYEALGDGIGMAVRSSATAEDMSWASFAGQYDTFLNVVGKEAILHKLREVWASLYSARSVAYRLRLGIPNRSVSMAVVIQQQLQPEASGVLFTRDPVSGNGDRYLVNATFGLGEGVVTGQVPVDSFVIDSKSLEVLSRTVNRKDAFLIASPGGGIARVEVDGARQETPALTDSWLIELGKLASRITQLFKAHQDIEFAVADHGVQLLQSRPLTGIDETADFPVVWDNPADAQHRWLCGQGPNLRAREQVYRLQEDVIRTYAEGSRVCFRETGSHQARNHIVRFFNGYTYTRYDDTDEAEVARRRERHLARDHAYREQGTSLYEAEILPEVEAALAEIRRFRPLRASTPEMVQHLDRTLRAYGRVMGDLHWRMAGGFRIDWPSAYREITGEPEVASGALLQAIPNKTTHLIRWLRGLARQVQSDPNLQAIFKDRAYHRLQEKSFRERPGVRRFRARIRNLIRRYGMRSGRGFGSGTSFTTPTWSLDASQPLDLIASYSQQDLDTLDRLDTQGRQRRKQEEQRIRRLLSEAPEKLQRFNRDLALAIEEVKRMEDHNHVMEQGVHGALREAIYWTGRGLVRDGLLDHPDDVLHLSLAELLEIAVGGGPSDLRSLARKRAEEMERRSRFLAPPVLGHGDPPPRNPLAALQAPPQSAGLDGTILRGLGASPGKAVGRARVVSMGATPPPVEQGDILVAPNAGPAWTPMFPLLGGLVLDEGAVFQHAALVAREYGIPAVIMTRDATNVVLDGQTIGVDADQGIVELVP